jgi:hypothetical protein
MRTLASLPLMKLRLKGGFTGRAAPGLWSRRYTDDLGQDMQGIPLSASSRRYQAALSS